MNDQSVSQHCVNSQERRHQCLFLLIKCGKIDARGGNSSMTNCWNKMEGRCCVPNKRSKVRLKKDRADHLNTIQIHFKEYLKIGIVMVRAQRVRALVRNKPYCVGSTVTRTIYRVNDAACIGKYEPEGLCVTCVGSRHCTWFIINLWSTMELVSRKRTTAYQILSAESATKVRPISNNYRPFEVRGKYHIDCRKRMQNEYLGGR